MDEFQWEIDKPTIIVGNFIKNLYKETKKWLRRGHKMFKQYYKYASLNRHIETYTEKLGNTHSFQEYTKYLCNWTVKAIETNFKELEIV